MTTYLIDPGDWSQSNTNPGDWYFTTGVSIPTMDVVNVYISTDGEAYTPLPTTSFFHSDDLVTFV